MLPRKAIQSEEKTARFISLVAILRAIKLFSCIHVIDKDGYICRYRKALYSGSLGISLYLELFCFLSFISFVLSKLT